MRARALAGRRVVVTRPRGRADETARRLSALGAEVVRLPLVAIEPPRPEAAAALDAALRALASFDWVVFTSPHGVESALRRLDALGRGSLTLQGVRTAAVGPGTAEALLRNGVRPDVVAQPSSAKGLVERFAGAAPAAILHPTSDRARPELARGLRRAGHHVAEVIAYRTRAAPPDVRALQRALAADAFVVCSPSAAEQLKRHRLPSRRGVVACLGPTTARAARRLGLRVASVASRPTPEALAEAVVLALREKRSA